MEKTILFSNFTEATAILGHKDEHLKYIQQAFSCHIIIRRDAVQLEGTAEEVSLAARMFEELQYLYRENTYITPQHIRFSISMVRKGCGEELHEIYEETVNITARGRVIKPKTLGQKRYVDSIRKNLVTFGIGPAGTGKTYLAVALASFFLKNHDVERIILTRPAVEAGEKLGYLPGDLQDKIDPYLRPLYDALTELFGGEQFQKYQSKNIIEVAPLAYMRGRTLENAFIILDEAQNTTPEQMRMFLTRMGNNSKMVVNGDITQIDLPGRQQSGLIEAEKVLRAVKGIGTILFTDEDVVRHDMVARIVRAYEAYHRNKSDRSEV